MLRFAPSPTGDMHIGNLRAAIFNFIIAKQKGEKFLIRIEDTDSARNIEGADKEILALLNLFGLFWDKLVYQSDNFPLHRKLAQNLIEKNKAFYCYATKDFLDKKREEASAQKRAFRYKDEWAEVCKNENQKPVIRLKGIVESATFCHSERSEESKKNPSLRDSAKQNRGNPPIEKSHDLQGRWLLRDARKSFGLPRSHSLARNDENLDSSLRKCSAQNDKIEAENDKSSVRVAESALDSANHAQITESISFFDAIKGECKFSANEIDSFVILREDKTPTYNFACAVDDMIYDISFIIRGEDHTSNTPKQMLIHRALGYDKAIKYAHLPIILNDEGKKMSKRESESSVKWLLSQGFLPRAIVNYLLLMGNNPPCEIFNLDEAISWFDLSQLSKSPVRFDINQLRHINREHLKRLGADEMGLLLVESNEKLKKVLNSSLGASFALGGNFGEQQTQKSSFIPKISSKYKTSTANTRICDFKNVDSANQAQIAESALDSATRAKIAESKFTNSLGAIGKIFLEEASTLNELNDKLNHIFAPRDLENFEFGENARILKNEILRLAESSAESSAQSCALNDFESLKSALSSKVSFKGKAFFMPLRFLLTGAQKGPHLDTLYPHLRAFLSEILQVLQISKDEQ